MEETEKPSSTAVLTISCEEDNCDSCDADIDQLPAFLNEFGRTHSTCLLCGQDLPESFKPPHFATIKVLKEVCIQTILPDVQVQPGVLDKSYPFCMECTEGKVTKLTDLYRQLQVLQEEFDEVRSVVVQGIIQSFVKDKEEQATQEEEKPVDLKVKAAKLFHYWKRYVGYPNLQEKMDEKDEDYFQDVSFDFHIPLPIPTSPEQSDGEVRVKSEPLDSMEYADGSGIIPQDFSFDQTELLPVLHLESQTETEKVPTGDLKNSEECCDSFGGASPNQSLNNCSDSDQSTATSQKKNNSKLKKLKSSKLKTIPKSLIKKCQDYQLPVIYTTSAFHKTSRKKRTLTRKLLLKEYKNQVQNLAFVRTKQKNSPVGDSDSASSSLGNNSPSERRAKKAKRKAIRTLVREPVQNQNKIKLFTKHSHRHHKLKTMQSTPPHTEIKQELESPLQAGTASSISSSDFDSDTNLKKFEEPVVTQVKRGRGRPRKYNVDTNIKCETKTTISKNNATTKTVPKTLNDCEEDRRSSDSYGAADSGENSSSDDNNSERNLRRSRRQITHPRNYLDLLKCTPSIVEGRQTVKIPNFASPVRQKRPRRSCGFVYPGIIPHDFFYDSDPSSDEDELIRKTFALETPEIKPARPSKSKSKRVASEDDQDSSDDFTVKGERPSRRRTTKKREQQEQPQQKRGRGRPRKSDTGSTPPAKKRQRKSKPEFIVKHEPQSPQSGYTSPSQLGEDFDFTIPHDVSAFSNLLTDAVRSCVKKVDPSPSPSRNRSRSNKSVNEKVDTDEEIDFSDGYEDDEFLDEGQSSDDSAEPKPKKIKVSKVGGGESKARKPKQGPKNKRVDTPKMCQICGKILMSSYNLTLHMRTHTNEKPYKCEHPDCGKSFYKPENLRTHKRKHTQERPYTCEVCNCKFSYRIVLRTHKAALHHIYDSEAVFECVPCSKKFIAESLLRKHFKICKSGDEKFTVFCTYCNLHFDDGNAFKEHQSTPTHSDIRKTKMQEARKESEESKKKQKTEEQKEVDCDQCGSKFPDQRLLQLHINKSHGVKPNPTCEVCKKSFSSVGSLRTHQVLHSEEKPFVCNECGWRTNTKVSLATHESKHNGLPYKCEYCDKGMKNLEKVYRRHLFTNHKEIILKLKPHICECCFLNFATKEELTSHLLIHRDTTCCFCGKIFSCRDEIRKHVKKCHSQPLPPVTNGKEGNEQWEPYREDKAKNSVPKGGSSVSTSSLLPPPPPYSSAFVTPAEMNFEQQYAVMSQHEHHRIEQQTVQGLSSALHFMYN